MVELLMDQERSQLLYKNVKIVREKGKILGLLSANGSHPHLISELSLKLLQLYSMSNESDMKLEEILHYQYLYITEIIAFLYCLEEMEIYVEPSLVSMIHETI